ncbi:hypothetical protein [Curtobacterium phage Reje]|uniref:hypothetical protein n=1 Tax=Curtobacterium phage Reje TaxID=2851069 RepID=UPI002202BE70|nr:hypothetical protein QEJ62_gp12 [Curtobacterium phage Reje]QXG07820.1 hypothetical protein [Curtobacterium phage Reje]
MADPTRIQQVGDQLLVTFDDGSTTFAFPTTSQTWLIKEPEKEAPTPDPKPDPGGEPDDGSWQWPFKYSQYVIQTGYWAPLAQYGMRVNPVSGVYRLHAGLDFGGAGITGLPIPAAAAGTVAAAGYNAGMGNHVWINHAGGFQTRYFHMVTTPKVATGAKVTKGQILGNVGSTGNSTGAHLHWETHTTPGVTVNPRDFMKARGVPES